MNTGLSKKAEKPDQRYSPREAVIQQVSSWKGVSVDEHRFGGVEFRLGRRGLGHLHPLFADLPFPRRIATKSPRRDAPNLTIYYPIPVG